MYLPPRLGTFSSIATVLALLVLLSSVCAFAQAPQTKLKWTVQPSPSPDEGQFSSGDVLTGVSVVSSKDVFAIGVGSAELFEHWDGTQWSVLPRPQPQGICGRYRPALSGVSAVSAKDVWAVGNCAVFWVIEHWDGTQWNIVSVGDEVENTLRAVTAISSNDVWAVGAGSGDHTALTLHWDGTKWSTIPSPKLGQFPNMLSVAGTSSTDVWAVGTSSAIHGGSAILHWDGTQWRVVPSPHSKEIAQLSGVVAISPKDAWAVGAYAPSSSKANHSLIEHWDGAAWTVVPTPDLGLTSRLYGVAAAGSNDVWAVGQINTDKLAGHTLTLHWNGTKWRLVPSPSPGVFGADLFAVTALPSGDVWTVGAHTTINNQGGTPHTLVLFTPQEK